MRNNWSNQDDLAFYQLIPKESLEKLYGAGGMLSVLNGKISASFFALVKGAEGTTLEVGSGRGRIIHALKKEGYQEHKITAVERNPAFISELEKEFPKLKIFGGPIQDFETKEKFDYIGCWYSLLMEFNATEQLALLTKLSQLSKPTTIIIIDIVPPDLESNATHKKGQNVEIQLAGLPPIHGYSPTLNELEQHAAKLNMRIAFVPYWTDTGRKRVQCIMISSNNPHLSEVQKLAQIKSDFFERKYKYEFQRTNRQSSKQVAETLNYKSIV